MMGSVSMVAPPAIDMDISVPSFRNRGSITLIYADIYAD